MSTPPEQPSSPRVRDLTRWRIPFHYAPSIAVGAIGIGMLLIGGVVGGFGGWVLAVALPIAIGAFLRSPWFALVPVAVWIGWLVHVGGAAPDADLSNTPFELGLLLATVGAGATLLAQRAVFPATERIAWKAPTGRLVPPLDDGATPPLAEDVDEDALDDEVVAGLQVTDEELAEAERAADADAAAADDEIDSDDADIDADADTDIEADAEGAVEAASPALDADSDDEPDEATDTDDARVEAEAGDTAGDDNIEPVAATNAAEADDTTTGDDVEPDADAEPKAAADADDAVEPVATELPVDADPAPLDEGGHVTEFSAISEADLEADASGDDRDHDRTSAHADPEAAQR